MPSGGRVEIKWDAESDRKLLLGVLKVHDIKVNHEAVAQFMTTDTSKPTASAIQNRLKKLKAMVKDRSAVVDATTSSAKMTTPRKRGKTAASRDTPSKKAKTTGGANGQAADTEDEDDEEGTKDVKVKGEDDGEDWLV